MSRLEMLTQSDSESGKVDSITVFIPGNDFGRNTRFEGHVVPQDNKTCWVANNDGTRDYKGTDDIGYNVHVQYDSTRRSYIWTFSGFKDGQIPHNILKAISYENE